MILKENQFLCRVDFESRALPKNAGFHWDSERKLWYTLEVQAASRLREFADGPAKRKIDESMIQLSSWSEALPEPPSGLRYMDHQVEAALFALSRNRSYLGLDPGLGKTIVAAVVARALKRKDFRIVYICPPFLTRNTQAEFKKWAPEISTRIYPEDIRYDEDLDCAIIPDSLLLREATARDLREFAREREAILFIDEAHRFKSEVAKRTISLLGGKLKGQKIRGIIEEFSRLVFLSGTPVPNRPLELYPILSRCAPETIDHQTRFEYGLRYCAGYDTGFGWDFSGASNVQELAAKVIHPKGRFMLRMKKALLNLPPKIEELFVFSDQMSPKLSKLNSKIGEAYGNAEDLIKASIAKTVGKGEEELPVGTYRRLLGQEKVGAACELIRSILEETEESILVFAYHKDVIAELAGQLSDFNPLKITGATSKQARHELVEEFQKNPERRLLIANYLAAGVGFTLTKATRVIFAEYSWCSGENDQASDRAHRIGQTGSVLVQYLVYQDSIDKAVIETILRKRKTTEQL